MTRGLNYSGLQSVTRQETLAHRAELRKALGLSLHRGVRPGPLVSERRAVVHAHLAPLIATLPKTRDGHLSESVARYAANRYFRSKYGWVIRGLESFRASQKLSETAILKDKFATYVQSVLHSNLLGSGFSEEDLVMLVSAIEQLVFDDVLERVESSYKINGLSVHEQVSRRKMLSIMQSYIVEGLLESNFSDPVNHMNDKANIEEAFPNWKPVNLFVQDIVGHEAYESNAATSAFSRSGRSSYSYEDTARIATRFTEEFGHWFSFECRKMKQVLIGMDVHGTGRVRLTDFYGSEDEMAWHFRESQSYLRELGALDVSSAKLGPQVLITNYVQGMSNCVLPGHHYSVCCADECEGIRTQLEALVPGPSASLSEVAYAVESHWGRSLSTPQRNTATNRTLLADLKEVAAFNHGKVPLHSRLFAQWLHFVFPHECPYPHESGVLDPETPAKLASRIGEENVLVNDTAFQQVLNSSVAEPSPEAGAGMWRAREEHLVTPELPASNELANWAAMLAATTAGMAFVVMSLTAARRLSSICCCTCGDKNSNGITLV